MMCLPSLVVRVGNLSPREAEAGESLQKGQGGGFVVYKESVRIVRAM